MIKFLINILLWFVNFDSCKYVNKFSIIQTFYMLDVVNYFKTLQ